MLIHALVYPFDLSQIIAESVVQEFTESKVYIHTYITHCIVYSVWLISKKEIFGKILGLGGTSKMEAKEVTTRFVDF